MALALEAILSGISVLFFILLAIKRIVKVKNFCVICSTIALAWIILLALYFLEFFIDKMLLAILMGHTSLGVYYTLERKVKEKFLVFRLPYLLTSVTLVYIILEGIRTNALYLLVGIWGLFIIIYLLKFNEFTKKLIECCKKW